MPGGAEAALQAVGVAEGLLQRVELAVAAGQPLDGGELVAVGLDRQHQAGAHRLAVDEHRAGAADAVLAADVGAGEAELVAQEVGEQQPRLDLALVGPAVDRHLDRVAAHRPSPARRQASVRARRVSTRARCRL